MDGKTYRDLGVKDRPFSLGSQEAVDLLESIMPSDKAQAVPYAMIWEIDPSTGQAQHHDDSGLPKYPLSISLITPPSFGSSMSSDRSDADVRRFRERAPVSMERITIKTVTPRGTISYRTVQLSFVVHRPDVVFEKHFEVNDGVVRHTTDADSWSSLIYPGQCFALEYGWSASSHVKNGILNGEGYEDKIKGVMIPGREQIRFQVTTYDFQIQQNGQISFNVIGYELGESGMRHASVIKDDDKKPSGSSAPPRKIVDPYANSSSGLNKLLKKFQDHLKKQKGQPQHGSKMVKFGDLFDEIFGGVIKETYKAMGFGEVELYIGSFNSSAGTPVKRYSNGADVSGKPISEFTIPLDVIEGIFKELLKAGKAISLYNFLTPFVTKLNDPNIWNSRSRPSTQMIPDVKIRTITNRGKSGKMDIFFYMFDHKSEITKLTTQDDKKLPRKFSSRSEIMDHLRSVGVPFISLVRANSFVQTANFNVIQDQQMQGIFVRRVLGKDDITRDAGNSQPSVVRKLNQHPAQKIFSPTIEGSVTMLGNFVFDVFSLVWLDFGVSTWDGPFDVLEKEDVIERGSFTTTLKIFASGNDPLGTQGR